MRRRSAALGIAMTVATACGGGGASAARAPTTGPPVPETAQETTVVPSSMPVTTALRSDTRPTTTRPASPPPTAARGRTVPAGETFSMDVGERVSVSGDGLSLTFSTVVSDNRCRPGRQCIVAGNAVLAVAVSTAGTSPASLTLNTTDGPTSARYGNRTVELVQLSFGVPPVARLRVT